MNIRIDDLNKLLNDCCLPSSGADSPNYNPGGPGNNPSSNPAGPFTVPSSDQTVNITNNLKDGAYVTYVEIDGPVAKNALGQHPR